MSVEQEILRQLTEITKDHEKRLRMLEKVMFGALAIVSFVEFLRKGL